LSLRIRVFCAVAVVLRDDKSDINIEVGMIRLFVDEQTNVS
jgi:hypothetical protein